MGILKEQLEPFLKGVSKVKCICVFKEGFP